MTNRNIGPSAVAALGLAIALTLVTACSPAAVDGNVPSYAVNGYPANSNIGNQNTSTFPAVAGGY